MARTAAQRQADRRARIMARITSAEAERDDMERRCLDLLRSADDQLRALRDQLSAAQALSGASCPHCQAFLEQHHPQPICPGWWKDKVPLPPRPGTTPG